MKSKILVSALLALAVAGCADKGSSAVAQAEPATAPVATTGEVAATEPQPCPESTPFYSPMPDAAIRFDFPFRIARDRVYDDNKGIARRGLSLEYLDGTPESIWNAVSSTMVAAGYKASAPNPDTPYSGTFTKSGQTGIFAKVGTDPVKSPTGEDVKGSVWFSWSVKQPDTQPATP